MWRWEDVKMRRCEVSKREDEKVWRWEDVKVRRCEDEKVWRWENVKMRRWDTDPHYWENPALRRSREKKHEKKWKKRCSFSKQTVVIWRTNLQDWHNDRLNKSTGQKICISYGGFHKWGYPKIDALFHGNPKNGWWPQVPPFQETILSEICLEAHMYNIYMCVYHISAWWFGFTSPSPRLSAPTDLQQLWILRTALSAGGLSYRHDEKGVHIGWTCKKKRVICRSID